MGTQYTKILFSDAPGHLPRGYTEEIYTGSRVQKIGVYEEKLVTQEKFKAIFDDNYEQRLIQAIVYDKYKVELIKTENYNIEIIQYAETIRIFSLDDNSEHHARILSFNFENIPGSSFQKIVIEYYDTYDYNYYNGSQVVNMLRSDSLIDRYSSSQLNHFYVYITAYTRYDFYSPFEAEKFVENENLVENELNGTIINSRITQKTKRKLTAYLNEADAFNLSLYGGLANNYTYRFYLSDSPSYLALERPTFEITKEPAGIDLYKVVITMTSAINNEYIYA